MTVCKTLLPYYSANRKKAFCHDKDMSLFCSCFYLLPTRGAFSSIKLCKILFDTYVHLQIVQTAAKATFSPGLADTLQQTLAGQGLQDGVDEYENITSCSVSPLSGTAVYRGRTNQSLLHLCYLEWLHLGIGRMCHCKGRFGYETCGIACRHGTLPCTESYPGISSSEQLTHICVAIALKD